eukprot:Phypoly_transcript_07664.p2 GENE.Phypoly_transcript_07664~~Phypoly_transcript_07664.p2  ORF type:complete len:187 (+),score=23.54 Phypoly_transcript_07664:939-1499(+)
MLVFVAMFVYPQTASNSLLLVVPPVICHLIGLFLTICISNLVPLYYVYQSDIMKNKNGSFEQFVSLLQYPSFRNQFYVFLTEQFCGENLQFYETVQAWKELDSVCANKRSNAQLIYENFVHDDGLCQVNIPSEIKIRMEEQMSKTDVPEDTFDDAYFTLLHDMYYNSFIYFRKTREFAESTTIELV